MNCSVKRCMEQVRWVFVGEDNEQLFCAKHAEEYVFLAAGARKPTAVHLYRIDCEGEFVKGILARFEKKAKHEEILLVRSVRQGV